jgi:hypothetical protein
MHATRSTRACSLVVLVWVCSTAVWAQTNLAGFDVGGQVRLLSSDQRAAALGPLAQANAVQPGTAAAPDSGNTLETELRASGHGITALATLQQQQLHSGPTDGRAWVNELYGAHDGGAWQFSAGKKVVDWDVGYGFRPNDIVQQEVRRTLVASSPEGRPLLSAEYFSADAAWSVVAVNPTGARSDIGGYEPALAARWYQRQGAADLHVFARAGAHTGPSVGGAVAWVATDALELHGSLRYASRIDTKAIDPNAQGVVASNPWLATTQTDVSQLLLGGTWTHESQLSLLAEAWWDGTAPSDAQWDAWAQRNAQLAALAGAGPPAAAVAGNLAWQAQAFSVSPNVRRSNVFLRASWQRGAWSPALDLLYTPADGGRAITASVAWQGDHAQVQAGLRTYGGPDGAVLAQLPVGRQVYVAGTWKF